MIIIVSARSLSAALKESFVVKHASANQELTIYLEGRELLFDVTAKKIEFEPEVTAFEHRTLVEHLWRLKEVLNQIPDQPVTLDFSGNGWIGICSIEV